MYNEVEPLWETAHCQTPRPESNRKEGELIISNHIKHFSSFMWILHWASFSSKQGMMNFHKPALQQKVFDFSCNIFGHLLMIHFNNVR